jgi:uncharacterized membrane protein YcaP (DUF421 family)
LPGVDWQSIFVPQHSIPEAVLRGSFMYLAIFAMLRIVLRRNEGGIGTSDILVIVLMAEVAGTAIAPADMSVVEGTILVATILFWSFAIEWAQHRFPAFERLVRNPKLKLIDNGRMLRRNMRRELITTEELMAQLRKQGHEDCSRVKAAYIEDDGAISIIEKDRD